MIFRPAIPGFRPRLRGELCGLLLFGRRDLLELLFVDFVTGNLAIAVSIAIALPFWP